MPCAKFLVLNEEETHRYNSLSDSPAVVELKTSLRREMRPQVILFGDSITEESFSDGGWGASLTDLFSRRIDFVLRGYSGYNTRGAIHALDKILSSHKSDGPIAVTVFFGANDASLPDRSSGFQHVPLVEYKSNLHSIVSTIKKRWPTTLVLLITPPPIDEDGRVRCSDNPTGQPERTNEAAGAYARECCNVAVECGVPVVDLWSKMQQFADWEKSCLSDGLHLTPTGNKIVFEEVVEKFKQEGLSLETLPVDLPLFMDIDPKDPLKAFQN